jgi:hypothetical protein
MSSAVEERQQDWVCSECNILISVARSEKNPTCPKGHKTEKVSGSYSEISFGFLIGVMGTFFVASFVPTIFAFTGLSQVLLGTIPCGLVVVWSIQNANELKRKGPPSSVLARGRFAVAAGAALAGVLMFFATYRPS